ncbi:hypothetical protein V1478_006097 [Vespula squamosa]|uniref:Uncharacterized protein n=1 Tax=Vespula squamosa TaxID=30214 RepID=A0ABD2B6W6_VESSQ
MLPELSLICRYKFNKCELKLNSFAIICELMQTLISISVIIIRLRRVIKSLPLHVTNKKSLNTENSTRNNLYMDRLKNTL